MQCRLRVKLRNTQREQMFSGLPQVTDIVRSVRLVRFGANIGSQLRAVRAYSGERRLSAIPYFNEVLIDVNLVLSLVQRSNRESAPMPPSSSAYRDLKSRQSRSSRR